MSKYKYIQTFSILGLIYIFNLFFYLKDVNFVLNKENILTSFDGYIYASYAKQLLDGSYKTIDYLRNVPDFTLSPSPIPMNSYIAYILVKFLGIKLETIIVFTSAILTPLLVFTMYLYTKKFLPIYAFISGAILSSLNSVYYSRNIPGRFDTDSLILFFVFLILFFVLKIIENLHNLKKSIFYLLALTLCFNIFMWWYSKPLFANVFLASIIFGFITFYFKDLKNKNLLKNISIVILTYIIALWPFLEKGFYGLLYKIFHYVFKQPEAQTFIPESNAKFISELQPANINIFLDAITDNIILAIIGIIGFLLVLKRHFKYISVAIPIIVIGLLSFKSGVRFLIYLIPFIGMGIGYFYYIIYEYLKKKFIFLEKNLYKLTLIALIIISSFPVSIALVKPIPVVNDEIFYSLKEAKNKLENKSYVWYTWSYGYPLRYILDKGVYVDNGNQNIIKNFAIANSFYTNSLKKSYKLISFITNHFYDEYSKLSLKEFNKKVENYNKSPKNTVYIVLTKKLPYEVSTTRQGVYNTNIKNFEIPMVKNITKCLPLENKLYYCRDFFFNVERKLLLWNPSYIELAKNPNILETIFINRDKKNIKKLPFYMFTGSRKNLILEIVYIQDKRELFFSYIIPVFYNTTFNKLFFLDIENKYFKKVYDDFPNLVVFKAQ
ncbi:MAG: hypothetical protein DSY47_05255 [Hydrogenothermus sp.]|nr:MAG: hypothetical protein DSY47_05255 [Hydrogenothermus sp.]